VSGTTVHILRYFPCALQLHQFSPDAPEALLEFIHVVTSLPPLHADTQVSLVLSDQAVCSLLGGIVWLYSWLYVLSFTFHPPAFASVRRREFKNDEIETSAKIDRVHSIKSETDRFARLRPPGIPR
jgi:hypothetical protein